MNSLQQVYFIFTAQTSLILCSY